MLCEEKLNAGRCCVSGKCVCFSCILSKHLKCETIGLSVIFEHGHSQTSMFVHNYVLECFNWVMRFVKYFRGSPFLHHLNVFFVRIF